MSEENQNLSYGEYVKPLITAIRDAVNEQLESSDKEYTEFDVYNALSLSISLVASRNLGDDSRDKANDESNKLSKAMLDIGLEVAQKDQMFLASLILGAARTVSSMCEIAENIQGENDAAAETEQEVAPAEESSEE